MGTWAVPSWYLDLKLALFVVMMVVSITACLLAGLWALAVLILVGFGGLLLFYRLWWKRISL